MRLLVACKADPRVEQELVTDGVAQSMILSCDNDRALMSLTAVLLVLDLSKVVVIKGKTQIPLNESTTLEHILDLAES